MVCKGLLQDAPARQRIIIRHEETLVETGRISVVQVNPLSIVAPKNIYFLTKSMMEPLTVMGHFEKCHLEKNIAEHFSAEGVKPRNANARQFRLRIAVNGNKFFACGVPRAICKYYLHA